MFRLISRSAGVPGLFRAAATRPTFQKAHYHEAVVDHYENPRNVGSLNKNSKNVGTGLVGAPACGDVMKLQLEVNVKAGSSIASSKRLGVVLQ